MKVDKYEYNITLVARCSVLKREVPRTITCKNSTMFIICLNNINNVIKYTKFNRLIIFIVV